MIYVVATVLSNGSYNNVKIKKRENWTCKLRLIFYLQRNLIGYLSIRYRW